MKTKRFINEIKEYDDDNNLINTTIHTVVELTPDEGKCFKDKTTGERFIRMSDGKGAVIETMAENLSNYEEVDI